MDTSSRSITQGVIWKQLLIFFFPILLGSFFQQLYNTVDTIIYTRIYFTGSIASLMYNMGAGLLRAMGDSKRPMYFLIAACFTNIVLDYVFVVYLSMGIAGVGIATVLSQFVSAVLVLVALMARKDENRLRIHDLRFERSMLSRILALGIPAGLQYVMFDLSNLIVQASINSFGDATIAAWTAYVKSDAITWMISGAFGVSVTTFVGQNFGAQKYDRIRKCVRVAMGMSIAVVGALSAVLILGRNVILGIYTPDAEVIRIGAEMMVSIMVFNVLFMPIEIFAGTMRGTGYAIAPTVIMSSCVCLVRIVWIALLVPRYHTVNMVTVVYPISWLLASIVFLIVYLRGTWLHKRIALLGLQPEVRTPRRCTLHGNKRSKMD